MNLKFLWDLANLDHIARHNITSNEVEQVVENDPVDIAAQLRNGENRLAQVGETLNGRVLVVITTMRDEAIRVVTAYPANRNMRNFYAAQREGQDAEDLRDSSFSE